MKKILIFLILPALLISCKKTAENIVWEKSYGTGKAVFVKSAGDTGFVSCGESGGRQYLLSVDKNGNKIFEYKSESQGLLTSCIAGNGYYLSVGSSGGKMMISMVDLTGTVIWDSVFNSSFTVDYTSLCSLGGDSFLAIGSADPDSSVKATTGLSFVWFDGSGTVTQKTDSVYSGYIAVKGAAIDNSGNLYMAMTRIGSGGKLKAEVTKYNSDFQKLWEKELYNNPSYGAASQGIMLDADNLPVITGRTELTVSSGTENNTFVARYFFKGDSIQKQYLEYANSGSSVISDGAGQFMVLNSRCLIINILDQNIKVSGIIRTYSSCDSKTTDSFGYSMDMTGDGNIVIAGSKGDGYYIAVKSASALSPV
jgi:hypothetical protein